MGRGGASNLLYGEQASYDYQNHELELLVGGEWVAMPSQVWNSIETEYCARDCCSTAVAMPSQVWNSIERRSYSIHQAKKVFNDYDENRLVTLRDWKLLDQLSFSSDNQLIVSSNKIPKPSNFERILFSFQAKYTITAKELWQKQESQVKITDLNQMINRLRQKINKAVRSGDASFLVNLENQQHSFTVNTSIFRSE